MTRYIARRLLAMIPLLLGISFIVFSLLNILPGDPVSIMLSSNPHITPDAETIAQLRAQYGLDKPLMTQYLIFLQNLFKGDLGTSVYTQQPVVPPSRNGCRNYPVGTGSLNHQHAVAIPLE